MTGIQKSAGATERLVSRAMGGLSAALAGVSAIALARALLSIADEAKKLDATLKLATAGFGSFGKAQEDVRRIADDTRSGLSETASLYANFVRGAKELGGTQAEAARATETFSKTLKISGADANQAASATLQFGQALAAGALRGDELNSILEASPRLARLLADAMGRPIGEIKKLGEEGALTSDKLLKALTDKKFTAGIDSEFREIPVTFDEAMTKVYNAAVVTFGAFDRGGEFSTMLADFVGDGADGFADLEKRAEDFGISVRSTMAGLSDAFQPMLDGGLAVFEALGGGAFDLQQYIRQTLKEADALLNIGPGIANRFGAGGKFDSKLLANYDARQKSEQQRLQGQAGERRLRAMIGGYDVMGNPLPGTPAAGRGAGSRPSTSGSTKKGPKSPLNPEAFAREEAALNDRILGYKSDDALSAEQRADIELKRIEASRTAADKDVQTEKRYTKPQQDKIVALNGQVAALESARVIYERDAEIAKRDYDLATAGNRSAADLARSQADIAVTRQQQYEAEKRILMLRQSQERADYELLLKSRDPNDVLRGRAGLANLDEKEVNERKALGRQFASPLERYADQDTSDAIEELVVQELEYVKDGISNAITKRLGIKDPFLSGLLDLFIQEQIMKPLAEALKAAGGSGGGVIGAIGGVLGFASGGSMTIGGRGGTDTNRLSLNGRPIANVSRGETLSVGNKALNGGRGGSTIIQPIIQVDARGAVMNDQFASMILAQAGQQAQGYAAQMGQGILRGVPSRMAQFQTDGT